MRVMDRSSHRLAPGAIAWPLLLSALLLVPPDAFAHCDGLDGPVVKAAEKALESGNVSHALVWVRESDEAEIRKAFQKTLAVRRLGPEAASLADLYFSETLVRIHRAGEGEPYTGLKPAGRDLGPAIPAADRAVETGSPEVLVALLSSAMRNGIDARLQEVLHHKRAATADDVAAGRRFVAAYVAFIHYADSLFSAAATLVDVHSAGAARPGHSNPDAVRTP